MSKKVDPARHAGKLKWYAPHKGYGFIEAAGFDADVFLHASELTRSKVAPLDLRPGEAVEFSPKRGLKGVAATSIKVGEVHPSDPPVAYGA